MLMLYYFMHYLLIRYLALLPGERLVAKAFLVSDILLKKLMFTLNCNIVWNENETKHLTIFNAFNCLFQREELLLSELEELNNLSDTNEVNTLMIPYSQVAMGLIHFSKAHLGAFDNNMHYWIFGFYI